MEPLNSGDPRFPMIHETLVVLREILLVAPKLADAAVIASHALREAVALAYWWLALKAVEWLFPSR